MLKVVKVEEATSGAVEPMVEETVEETVVKVESHRQECDPRKHQ